MTLPVYILSSGLIGQRSELNLVAENVANINTPGFKGLMAGYENLEGRASGQKVGDFANLYGVVLDNSPGIFQKTGNPLDVAITGSGYFAVRGPNDDPLYTRNGQFRMDITGQLVDDKNQPVLDQVGVPIVIPSDASSIFIAQDGTVSADDAVVGQLGVFEFTPEAERVLTRVGNSSFKAPEGVEAQIAIDSKIEQGFIESSNVTAIDQVIRMSELQRAYESSLKSVQSIEDLESRAIRTISQIPQ